MGVTFSSGWHPMPKSTEQVVMITTQVKAIRENTSIKKTQPLQLKELNSEFMLPDEACQSRGLKNMWKRENVNKNTHFISENRQMMVMNSTAFKEKKKMSMMMNSKNLIIQAPLAIAR